MEAALFRPRKLLYVIETQALLQLPKQTNLWKQFNGGEGSFSGAPETSTRSEPEFLGFQWPAQVFARATWAENNFGGYFFA